MKTYDERTKDVLKRISRLRSKRRATAVAAAVCAGVLALSLVLFLPLNTNPPSVRQYRNSQYYDLIRKINVATYQKPRYANNFEKLFSAVLRNVLVSAPGGVKEEAMETMPVSDAMDTGNAYQEVTDNQVAGVIEGDLIKRTDRHIFYLHAGSLSVYSIAGESSGKVGSYKTEIAGDAVAVFYEDQEMYLSADGAAVTLILPGFGDVLTAGTKEAFVCVVTLDVSNPEAITETGRVFLTGSYLSSRLVDGKLLLISRYQIGKDFSFDKPETFLPRLGIPGNMQCVAAEDIIAPEELTNTRYTVVTMLDQKDLTAKDSAAFLSYSEELYVSKEHIFATRSYTQLFEENGKNIDRTMTQITSIGYSGGELIQKGSVVLEGTVKNQYSMDEQEGILRVVTSTTERIYEYYSNDEIHAHTIRQTKQNVNLYCVSLSNWSIAGSVIAFAPEGETAESVRFDANTAYVCTAEVITLTDPVYYFDLSDLSNITWKDTGTIDGYSSSLVNFGDYLLGIGYNGSRELKIEIYQETQTGVESVAVYERCCSFSEDYKSYLIDRENQWIGLGVTDYEDASGKYILLQFDGYQLRELRSMELNGRNECKRAVLIDGWLYLLGEEAELKVENLW